MSIQYIDVIRANHKYSLYVQYIAERFGAELFSPDDSTSDRTRAVRHLTRLAEQSDMSFQKTAMIVRDLYLELAETNPLVKNQVVINEVINELPKTHDLLVCDARTTDQRYMEKLVAELEARTPAMPRKGKQAVEKLKEAITK